jgi:hypothetical protein
MGYNPWPKTQTSTVAGRAGRTTDLTTQNSKVRRAMPVRLGVISAIYLKGGTQPIPFIKVKWVDDPSKESGWIPLEDHPMAIAQFYAAKLEDLVGQYTVKVQYHSENSSSGTAKIVGSVTIDPEQVDPQIESSGVKLI